MKKLKLGVSKVDITPEIGCHLYGYNDFTFSKDIHDRLDATAFAFESGKEKALLITAAVCLIHNTVADRVRVEISKECGVPFENIIVAAIHTHTGPNTTGNTGWGEIDEKYVDTVFVPQLKKAAKEACENKTLVTVGIGKGESKVGINRRAVDIEGKIQLGQKEWGCFNPTMTVLSFKDTEGKVIANLVHYGCHGTAAGMSTSISRDWAGQMCDMLEKVSGGVTAFFNGPEGDVGPRISNGYTTGNMSYVEELGTVAGLDAIRVFNNITGYHEADLECLPKTVKIPLSPRISLDEAKAELAKRSDYMVNLDGQITAYLQKTVKSYEEGYEEKEFEEVPQTIIRIGPLAIVSFPYEVFSEIGLRISKFAKIENVLCLSNSNGTEGYFVTESELCLGGYEVTMFKTRGVQLYAPYADNALLN